MISKPIQLQFDDRTLLQVSDDLFYRGNEASIKQRQALSVSQPAAGLDRWNRQRDDDHGAAERPPRSTASFEAWAGWYRTSTPVHARDATQRSASRRRS
jgi:hypothetical protein